MGKMLKGSVQLPKFVRVSLGSAIAMGVLQGKADASPTTVYLMTFKKGKCSANCGFCPQARKSASRSDMLSRISWPMLPTSQVLVGIHEVVRNDSIKRVCIQALNYPKAFEHSVALAQAIRRQGNVPISVSCQPMKPENLKRLADAGIERIGIPLDAATEELFEKTKGSLAGGPYSWERQFELLQEAVEVFGRGKVSTHLIVGLGETEKEMIGIIEHCVSIGVLPALFAFTPILGTALADRPQPAIQQYRRVQIARMLLLQGVVRSIEMQFSDEGQLISFGVDEKMLSELAAAYEPFLTSGCPDCNRPYYNEKPSGPIYNFPRQLTKAEHSEAIRQLSLNEA